MASSANAPRKLGAVASKSSTRKSSKGPKKSYTLKTIVFDGKTYRPDKKRDVYITDEIDGRASILVFCSEDDRWRPYYDINTVNHFAKLHDDDSMDSDDQWCEFTIDLVLYDDGVQFIDYEENSEDAGEAYLARNAKLLLKLKAPDLYEQVKVALGQCGPGERTIWSR